MLLLTIGLAVMELVWLLETMAREMFLKERMVSGLEEGLGKGMGAGVGHEHPQFFARLACNALRVAHLRGTTGAASVDFSSVCQA